MRIHARIENDEMMSDGLTQVAGYKERYAHFFQRVYEGQWSLRIRIWTGPENSHLKGEAIRKLGGWVRVLVNNGKKRHFFGV
jgi:hypothetical protein